jgi:2-(1,2-epoxy-1,2-dihydrophenyl)acetyl-CoA isomerase
MARFVTEEISHGLSTITLDRPDRRNAISMDLAEDLLAVVARAAGDPKVRAVLLRGAGGTFSVGGDVKGMANGDGADRPIDQRITELRRLMRVSQMLHDMRKPTVAALDGACAGGGLSIALACDLRIAARSTKITTAFAKVALPGDFGGTYLMTRLLGSAKARELYFLCPLLTAEEALHHGLVTKVVADDKLHEVAHDIAMSLAQGPSVTLAHMKQNLNLAEDGSFDACLNAEAMQQIRAMSTRDHQEAARAFVEKRKPVFQGK